MSIGRPELLRRAPVGRTYPDEAAAADAIQRLLTFLDESEGIIGEDVFDGDEDAAVDDAGCDEDCDTEPSLGWVDMEARYRCKPNNGLDLEEQCEDEGKEHDGREPDEDKEPSLGWPDNIRQENKLWGAADDREASAEPAGDDPAPVHPAAQQCTAAEWPSGDAGELHSGAGGVEMSTSPEHVAKEQVRPDLTLLEWCQMMPSTRRASSRARSVLRRLSGSLRSVHHSLWKARGMPSRTHVARP